MKGICFIEPLHDKTVKKIKVQTRRIISKEDYVNGKNVILSTTYSGQMAHFTSVGCSESFAGLVARYKIDDILYLKEPYRFAPDVDFIIYKFDYPNGRDKYPGCDKVDTPVEWKNKLFMPASAARHFIKITGVRAERLQDITEEDCRREGILDVEFYPDEGFPLSIGHTHYDDGKSVLYTTRKKAYAALIDKINGKGTWDSNPFVWVYDYELIEKEGKP